MGAMLLVFAIASWLAGREVRDTCADNCEVAFLLLGH